MEYTKRFETLSINDIAEVGGKNASLGEMIAQLSERGVKVPGGFATTASAYRAFIDENGLADKIYPLLAKTHIQDVNALAAAGAQVREWILAGAFSAEFSAAVTKAYNAFVQQCPEGVSFAVRSSATAEDLPNASFAGQQETYLHVSGIDDILVAIKKVFASLYTDRAITYRVQNGFEHDKVALSAGVQMMVRSDLASSGVMFSLDTESGFDQVVFITAAYGLGETVVQGMVNPDEYHLFKPALATGHDAVVRRQLGKKAIKMVYSDDAEKTAVMEVDRHERQRFALTDAELAILGDYAMKIEAHYQRPMDIEWAKDGLSGELYIVQARPETVRSQETHHHLDHYRMQQHGECLLTGSGVGEKIAAGKVRILQSSRQMDQLQPGEILVADITDPDWEPIMAKAGAIITNRGGRTCHAAIIARELGIPAVVGCQTATTQLCDGDEVTVSCAEGSTGYIYSGVAQFDCETVDVDQLPELPVKLMMNVGNPEKAFSLQVLPNKGVGLARMEFIIDNHIGVHPNACLQFETLDKESQDAILQRSAGYEDPVQFYVKKLQEGIATLCAAFYPKPVIVRTSDFKTNEYANLLGGAAFEPEEENPMLGFRGASRYISPEFEACFQLECQALRAVREAQGLDNLAIMIPFVRTLAEADQVLAIMEKSGLKRGENGLKVMMMCEVPSNVILADEFLQRFDGFSIGSNDLTQLTLGCDRDSERLASTFDERNPALKWMLERAIKACRQQQRYIGICGQGPSDHLDLAEWLVEQGIESMSLNPDSVVKTWVALGAGPR